MSQDINPVNLIIGIGVTLIVAFLAIYVVDALISTGMAPEQGDPLRPAWDNLIDGFSTAIVLLAGGTLAVLAFIVALLRGGF